MLLIKIQNTGATGIGTGATGLPANSVTYHGFGQGAVQTDEDGRITHVRITNGSGYLDLSQAANANLIVEVGVLVKGPRGVLQAHLTSNP